MIELISNHRSFFVGLFLCNLAFIYNLSNFKNTKHKIIAWIFLASIDLIHIYAWFWW